MMYLFLLCDVMNVSVEKKTQVNAAIAELSLAFLLTLQ